MLRLVSICLCILHTSLGTHQPIVNECTKNSIRFCCVISFISFRADYCSLLAWESSVFFCLNFRIVLFPLQTCVYIFFSIRSDQKLLVFVPLGEFLILNVRTERTKQKIGMKKWESQIGSRTDLHTLRTSMLRYCMHSTPVRICKKMKTIWTEFEYWKPCTHMMRDDVNVFQLNLRCDLILRSLFEAPGCSLLMKEVYYAMQWRYMLTWTLPMPILYQWQLDLLNAHAKHALFNI